MPNADLLDDAWVHGDDDESIGTVIRTGVLGDMPPFPMLSDRGGQGGDRLPPQPARRGAAATPLMPRSPLLPAAVALAATAAALLVAGCGAGADERAAPRLYRDYCARCHGRRGAGMQRPDGFDPGLDLTASAMIAAGRREEIRRRIAEGRGTMPGFARRLSAEEIDQLIDFVVGFAPSPRRRRRRESERLTVDPQRFKDAYGRLQSPRRPADPQDPPAARRPLTRPTADLPRRGAARPRRVHRRAQGDPRRAVPGDRQQSRPD